MGAGAGGISMCRTGSTERFAARPASRSSRFVALCHGSFDDGRDRRRIRVGDRDRRGRSFDLAHGRPDVPHGFGRAIRRPRPCRARRASAGLAAGRSSRSRAAPARLRDVHRHRVGNRRRGTGPTRPVRWRRGTPRERLRASSARRGSRSRRAPVRALPAHRRRSRTGFSDRAAARASARRAGRRAAARGRPARNSPTRTRRRRPAVPASRRRASAGRGSATARRRQSA